MTKTSVIPNPSNSLHNYTSCSVFFSGTKLKLYTRTKSNCEASWGVGYTLAEDANVITSGQTIFSLRLRILHFARGTGALHKRIMCGWADSRVGTFGLWALGECEGQKGMIRNSGDESQMDYCQRNVEQIFRNQKCIYFSFLLNLFTNGNV